MELDKNTQIKKVFADKEYKNNYIFINGNIYSVATAVRMYPKSKERLFDVIRESDDSNTVFLDYEPLPETDEMLFKIINKREEIIENLNIDNIKAKSKEKIKAGLLYDYIVKNIRHDATCEEEIEINYSEVDSLDDKCDKIEKEIGKLRVKKLHIETDISKEKVRVSEFCKKQKKDANAKAKIEFAKRKLVKFEENKQKEIDQVNKEINDKTSALQDTEKQADKMHAKANNVYIIKNIYNALIKNKATAEEMALAYSFLLKEANLNSYITTVVDEATSQKSFINLVQKDQKAKKTYYIVNLEEGQRTYAANNHQVFNGFLQDRKDYFNNSNDNVIAKLEEIKQFNEQLNVNEPIFNIIENKTAIDLIFAKTLKKQDFSEQLIDLYLMSNNGSSSRFYQDFGVSHKNQASNTKIKRVFIGKEFEKNYVSIDNSIYELDYAKANFSKLTSAIEKVSKLSVDFMDNSHLHEQQFVVKKDFFTYPSHEEMKTAIREKLKEITEFCNDEIKLYPNDLFSQTAFAAKVFDQIAKNTTFDMSVLEEMNLQEYDAEMAKIMETPIDPKEDIELRFDKIKKLRNEKDKKIMVKSVYNILVRNKGVCRDLINSYNYVLNKNNIPAKTLKAKRKDVATDEYHEVSLVPLNYDEEGVSMYYIADLNNAVNAKNKYTPSKATLVGFGEGRLKLEKMYKIASVLPYKHAVKASEIEIDDDTVEDIEKINNFGFTEKTIEDFKTVVFENYDEKEKTL